MAVSGCLSFQAAYAPAVVLAILTAPQFHFSFATPLRYAGCLLAFFIFRQSRRFAAYHEQGQAPAPHRSPTIRATPKGSLKIITPAVAHQPHQTNCGGQTSCPPYGLAG